MPAVALTDGADGTSRESSESPLGGAQVQRDELQSLLHRPWPMFILKQCRSKP
jgi:hypothetical protein